MIRESVWGDGKALVVHPAARFDESVFVAASRVVMRPMDDAAAWIVLVFTFDCDLLVRGQWNRACEIGIDLDAYDERTARV